MARRTENKEERKVKDLNWFKRTKHSGSKNRNQPRNKQTARLKRASKRRNRRVK